MTGVAFFYEDNDVDVWSGRNSDLDAWNYAIKLAGDITSAVVVNHTAQELVTFDADMDVQFVAELPSLPGTVCRLVCPWNDPTATPLWAFDHAPVDWYCFGPASGWAGYAPPPLSVCIPQFGRGALHSVHAATVVMADRYARHSGGG